ncbi:11479_t:CDS:2, partial [Entrophospora sp. SA101]
MDISMTSNNYKTFTGAGYFEDRRLRAEKMILLLKKEPYLKLVDTNFRERDVSNWPIIT